MQKKKLKIYALWGRGRGNCIIKLMFQINPQLFVIRRRLIKRECAVTVIQKYWRGYRSKVVLKEKWVEPKDRLRARTSSAIDFLFSIRDVAELICAVKTLDIETRLSEDCCKNSLMHDHGENMVRTNLWRS